MSDIDNQSSVPPSSPPPSAPPPTAPPPVAGTPTADERQMAMIAHLSALSGIVTGGVGNIVGPLIVWLIKKDTMPFVDDQGKEALNFNITLWIAGLVLMVLTFITFGIGAILTVPLGIALFIAYVVLTIVAGMKANEGVVYRYPATIRLIK